MRISDWGSDVCSSDLEGGDEHDRSCQNAVAPVGGGDRVAALERLWRVRLCDDQAQESRIYGGVHARAAELFLQLPAMGECRLGARRVGIGARLAAATSTQPPCGDRLPAVARRPCDQQRLSVRDALWRSGTDVRRLSDDLHRADLDYRDRAVPLCAGADGEGRAAVEMYVWGWET